MNEKHPIIFFDGVCNLCNSTVQKIIKRDKKGIFHFASLQSNTGQEFLKKHQLPQEDFDSFILSLPDDEYYTQSDAAVQVMKLLGGTYNLLGNAISFFPKFLRDAVYSFVAKYRYKWFGKQETCMLPQPEWKGRFLD